MRSDEIQSSLSSPFRQSLTSEYADIGAIFLLSMVKGNAGTHAHQH